MNLRPATAADAPALAAIYAHHVTHGLGTFEEAPPDGPEMARRLAAIQAQDLPWLVAVDEADRILGYAYAGPFRTRAAYRFTLEDSVYVSPDSQRQGVGRTVLSSVLDACASKGCRQMLALIGSSGNLGSIRLHEALGFAHVGVMRDVGHKAGQWVDVVVMQKALGAD